MSSLIYQTGEGDALQRYSHVDKAVAPNDHPQPGNAAALRVAQAPGGFGSAVEQSTVVFAVDAEERPVSGPLGPSCGALSSARSAVSLEPWRLDTSRGGHLKHRDTSMAYREDAEGVVCVPGRERECRYY